MNKKDKKEMLDKSADKLEAWIRKIKEDEDLMDTIGCVGEGMKTIMGFALGLGLLVGMLVFTPKILGFITFLGLCFVIGRMVRDY